MLTTPRDLVVGLWLAAMPMWLGAVEFPGARPDEAGSDTRGARSDSASLLDLSDEELARRIETDPTSLGSLSIGTAGSAILLNSVALPVGPRWEIPGFAEVWGTSETIGAIQAVIDKVHEIYPDSPPLVVGDISDEDGGRLKRHESHQGGRDVDFGFYHKGGTPGSFVVGTAVNMDLPRNWALVRAVVLCTDVEAIFLDTRVQRLLYKHALSVGEDKDWLDRVFQFSRGFPDAIIRHVPRHRNHYHVRFYNAVAQELGRRAHPLLVQAKVIDPPVFTVRHVVRRGQTLGHLAARYGTSTRAIARANGLKTSLLRAGRAYRIPVKTPAPPAEPVVVPLRMLPPSTPAALAGAAWPSVESLYADRLGSLTWNPALFAAAFRGF